MEKILSAALRMLTRAASEGRDGFLQHCYRKVSEEHRLVSMRYLKTERQITPDRFVRSVWCVLTQNSCAWLGVRKEKF